MKPSIAIIGASTNPHKFGNRAVRAYLRQGFEVYPIHPTARAVEGHGAYASILDLPVDRLDRVSFYVPPEVGMQVIEEVARIQVNEVWFNPGSESPELLTKARGLGLNVVEGCSILDVGVDPHGM